MPRSPRLIHTAALLALLAHSAALPATGAEAEAPPGAAALLAPQVQAIFQRSCAECHDAAVRRPKGGFGHVTDLDRLVEDGYYVVPGNPAQSMIHTVLIDPDPDVLMPPPDSDLPKLSDAEKEAVKAWILALAEAPTTPSPESTVPAPLDPPAADPTPAPPDAPLPEPSLPDPAPGPPTVAEPIPSPPTPESQAPAWNPLKIFARTHIMVVHFPIALLLLAVSVDWLGLLLRRGAAWLPAVQWSAGVAALASPVAVLAGWLLADMEGYKDSTVFLHRWLGVATMAAAMLGWGLLTLAEHRGSTGLRWVARLVLSLGALIVSVTGHTGGELVYGAGYPFN